MQNMYSRFATNSVEARAKDLHGSVVDILLRYADGVNSTQGKHREVCKIWWAT